MAVLMMENHVQKFTNLGRGSATSGHNWITVTFDKAYLCGE